MIKQGTLPLHAPEMGIPEEPLWQVGELTRYLQELLGNDQVLGFPVVVCGELSNVKQGGKGHWYFSLKDSLPDDSAEITMMPSQALLNCAMWQSYAKALGFKPEQGMQVYATGKLNIYPPSGTYSLHVTRLEPWGKGGLQQAFERLKAQFQEEGLFSPERKRPLPSFPLRVGIVTAPTGAVIHDMVRTIRQLNTGMSILLAPAKVQGEGASESIAHAIETLQNPELKLDVLIVARGGGSFEDLFCFSQEPVVRAIARSRIPVVTGIGHEPDYSLADAVADYSAATPTMAAEAITPNLHQWHAWLQEAQGHLVQYLTHTHSTYRQWVLQAEEHLCMVPLHLLQPARQLMQEAPSILQAGLLQRWHTAQQGLPHLQQSLYHAMQQVLTRETQKLVGTYEALEAYHPIHTLKRGYTRTTQGTKPVSRCTELNPNEPFELHFYDGSLKAQVCPSEILKSPLSSEPVIE
ncbi:MAG: exodeoxyribonuclease VII large subunit [Vampirovibrionales bacterium]